MGAAITVDGRALECCDPDDVHQADKEDRKQNRFDQMLYRSDSVGVEAADDRLEAVVPRPKAKPWQSVPQRKENLVAPATSMRDDVFKAKPETSMPSGMDSAGVQPRCKLADEDAPGLPAAVADCPSGSCHSTPSTALGRAESFGSALTTPRSICTGTATLTSTNAPLQDAAALEALLTSEIFGDDGFISPSVTADDDCCSTTSSASGIAHVHDSSIVALSSSPGNVGGAPSSLPTIQEGGFRSSDERSVSLTSSLSAIHLETFLQPQASVQPRLAAAGGQNSLPPNAAADLPGIQRPAVALQPRSKLEAEDAETPIPQCTFLPWQEIWMEDNVLADPPDQEHSLRRSVQRCTVQSPRMMACKGPLHPDYEACAIADPAWYLLGRDDASRDHLQNRAASNPLEMKFTEDSLRPPLPRLARAASDLRCTADDILPAPPSSRLQSVERLRSGDAVVSVDLKTMSMERIVMSVAKAQHGHRR